jgi:predicted unusual protein kinase regulating ubiquinone biosynthesis (AarF/ABC1/UbiB family)
MKSTLEESVLGARLPEVNDDAPPDGRGNKALPVPSGRFERIFQLGRAAGGMALSGAREKVRRLAGAAEGSVPNVLLTAETAKILATRLSRLRGAAMKVGQMLSLEGENLLPREFAQALEVLRSSAHHMPAHQLLEVIERELGPKGLERFAEFDREPLAAASIGQVHAAKTHQGESVVLKIQYPGVQESIDSDVDNLRSLVTLARLVPKDVDVEDFVAELKSELHREVDYRRELEQLSLYRSKLDGDPRFLVPRAYRELSTSRVLTLERMYAKPLLKWAEHASPLDRDRMGALLFELLLRELFDFGLSQTDPNPANFQVEDGSGRLVLLDFGATRSVEPHVRSVYRLAFEGLLERSREKIEKVIVALGVHNEAVPEATAIIVDMALEGAESMDQELYDFKATDLQKRVNMHSFKLIKFHGKLGTPPPEYVFFQRKLTGTFLLCRQLGARVACRTLTEEALGRLALSGG